MPTAEPDRPEPAGHDHSIEPEHDRLDPVSRLILDEAGPDLGRTLVLDDHEGALSAELIRRGVDVRVWCDDLRDERRLPIAALPSLGPATIAGVESVLLRLPKSLGALAEYVQQVAAWAAPTVRIVAGGRDKHLTTAMNEVLAGSFDRVWASRGRQKSRVLHAEGARPGPVTWPHTTRIAELGLVLVSHGGVFAGDRLDGGTRLLIQALDGNSPPRGRRAVDLGCGSGLIAAWLATRGHQVLAVDVSWAACRSAAATATANRVAVSVQRTDGLAGATPGSVDLVVCNPPFHRGGAKDSTPGFDLVRTAAPALSGGGELWTVFNSHLPYLAFLRAEVGPTRVVRRDRHYTVTRSVRT